MEPTNDHEREIAQKVDEKARAIREQIQRPRLTTQDAL